MNLEKRFKLSGFFSVKFGKSAREMIILLKVFGVYMKNRSFREGLNMHDEKMLYEKY